MTERHEAIPPATGEEFRPATGKLWVMLLTFALMVPLGAIAAVWWWAELPLPGGNVLSTKAGIASLAAIPLGSFLFLVMAVLIATAKRLVVAGDCVQLLSKDRVVVHIPFTNVAETSTTGDDTAGTVILVLRDRNDPATLVPASTKDRYEIQSMIYGTSPRRIAESIARELTKSRAE